MIRALRPLVCWLIGHKTLPHADKASSISYWCPRCCSMERGGLALAERYR